MIKTAITIRDELDDFSFIESIENLSGIDLLSIQRMRIHFKNGYQLSVIQGFGTFGVDQGLFEIAPFNLNGDMDGDLFDKEDQGDSVLGYCNKNKVIYYIHKIGNLSGRRENQE